AFYKSMYANKSFNRNPTNHRLYHALMEELIEDENAMDKGVADTVKDHKRKQDDDEDDDDEDSLAEPNQGKKTKRRRTKEFESSKKPSITKETPKGKAPTKGSKTDKLDWNNLEGDRYPVDLSKPLPLQGTPCHRTVAADYFFNNDLEYLKTSDLGVTYTISITMTKAARYKIKGIEDIVPTLWSDFVDLHLNDIEDMLLLTVQHKLFHLDGSDIVDFIVALRDKLVSWMSKKQNCTAMSSAEAEYVVLSDSSFELTAFSDADHAECIDTRKSTSGGIQFLGDNCAQVMWMRTQLQDYGFNYNKIPLYSDSQSAIAISCNPVQHSRSKHIHTRYHFIKEQDSSFELTAFSDADHAECIDTRKSTSGGIQFLGDKLVKEAELHCNVISRS
nr:hypothetical protein [Tanacetum cinerariifolium]